MPGKHFKSEYIDFRNSVVVGNQFVLDEQAQAFLDGIRKSAETRIVKLPKGSNVYRAQHGCVQKDWDEQRIPLQCHNKKRMLPDRSHVRAGRANAEYKAVFYASVTPEIAVKEMRPWIGSYLSVARFRIKRDLRIVNLFDAYRGFMEGWMMSVKRSSLVGKKYDDYVWHSIGEAFCQPVTLSDDPHCYLPTQIIAEQIKSLGYDGLAYRSSTEPARRSHEEAGANVALFDLGAVSMQKKGWVVKVKSLEVEIENGPHY
jgi:hypothetical protein